MSNEIEKGTRVRVSDGTPRPPQRHARKLGRWESRNFVGRVRDVETDGTLAVYPDFKGKEQSVLAVVVRPGQGGAVVYHEEA